MVTPMARTLNPSRQTTAADSRVATYDVRKVKAGRALPELTLQCAEADAQRYKRKLRSRH